MLLTRNKLHNFIDASHLYDTKNESWFKFLGLAFAWFGGLFWYATSENITQYSVAFFVYATALFMECFLKLTSKPRLPSKIYPLLIILCGTSILLDSIVQWRKQEIALNQERGLLPINALIILSFVPIVIVFLDTFFITLIEKTGKNESTAYKPENDVLKVKLRVKE